MKHLLSCAVTLTQRGGASSRLRRTAQRARETKMSQLARPASTQSARDMRATVPEKNSQSLMPINFAAVVLNMAIRSSSVKGEAMMCSTPLSCQGKG